MRFQASLSSYFGGYTLPSTLGKVVKVYDFRKYFILKNLSIKKNLKNIHTNKTETKLMFTKFEISGNNNISLTAIFPLRRHKICIIRPETIS
jgi:hypothetical protein